MPCQVPSRASAAILLPANADLATMCPVTGETSRCHRPTHSAVTTRLHRPAAGLPYATTASSANQCIGLRVPPTWTKKRPPVAPTLAESEGDLNAAGTARALPGYWG
ncbi:hypothetical protein ZWY2020_042928 [Hordeum vulgare]|nr:hypothetical protein ZWY2020_029071 [Hordeum vulgare]KAI5018040.1 hypothetical protein ZWY2020_042928 [Hordeum vulgare]